ncbi:hypothetical protein BDW59DRAFT_139286 [Aspergillus cavernicola]|uniref:Uncharacterized protein n=1 Tax=Aspergillus cavernicola TaxID=176166 RepID=A0ABR4IXG3_9EURO
MPPVQTHRIPFTHLHQTIIQFFKLGPHTASLHYAALILGILQGIPTRKITVNEKNPPQDMQATICTDYPWDSAMLATSLVLLLAAPAVRGDMLNSLKFRHEGLASSIGHGGRSTYELVCTSGQPSADLGRYFAVAKKAAVDGKVGSMTVLGVGLVDVQRVMDEEEERRQKEKKKMKNSRLRRDKEGEEKDKEKKKNAITFEHSFVLAIAREGFRVYQAYGENGRGYCLFESLLGECSELRSWDEGKKFLKAFAKIAGSKGTWTAEINKAYKECFYVDINGIYGERVLGRPLITEYVPYVRVHEIRDVTVDDIEKFAWDIGGLKEEGHVGADEGDLHADAVSDDLFVDAYKW